jgi:signal transduction histidine kinase
VSEAVSDAVLKKGGSWLGSAFVVDDWYVSAYEPLVDGQGRRVGMLYVGYTERPFRLVKYAMLASIAVLVVAMMAVAAVFSLRLARGIFRPVEQMNGTMQRFEKGDTAARVGAVSARDEIGVLAGHLDQLLEVIGQNTRSLQEWAQGLDLKVAERTRELARSNASLVQAQQQLVKSEKLAAIDQLTASIAHEINNPIAVLQGNLDLMRETLGPHAAPVEAELKLLDEQIQRMRLIVTQLLQYARPTEYAGYVETLDVNRVLDECLVLVGHLLGTQRIEVAKSYGASVAVGLNRQELQQVVINLVTNAEHAVRGRREAIIELATEAREGWVRLTVEDSGPGVPPEVRSRIFDPFFTTKSPDEGSGLGLSICQRIVAEVGGKIWLEDSTTLGGAKFIVELPAAPAEERVIG